MYESSHTLPLNFDASIMSLAREASEILKALSHEHRLMIMQLLLSGAKSVGELEDLTGLRQSAVSQQLARLRAANVVSARRNGKMVYYYIERAEVKSTIAFLQDTFFRK